MTPGSGARLAPDLAERLAGIALGHVRREYPHKPGWVFSGPEDVRTPREAHPAFHGSFDWHSCVHGYWMLARLLRRAPAMPCAVAVRALFAETLTPDRIGGEVHTFSRPGARGFERPYGWAWLLALAAELRGVDDDAAAALRPLADLIAGRFRDFLPLATYPVRAGTHGNTAFVLRLAADYAEAVGDAGQFDAFVAAARRLYAGDEACPAWGEPDGDAFLSPALIEAECMRRLLPADAFLPWFDRFLPEVGSGRPEVLFRPVRVSDRSDGKIAHLDGLNLSRAWCWRALAAALPETDPRRAAMLSAAEAHLAASLSHVAGEYMGEHWLATFAVLALEA
ncbi:DUF2891 domain-containing protein [Roseomonas sp. CCTCC AB2023176]|uniref:DUF2891 domain-containing protein n=1 Tax=Roseomonas sp. CCTCC AB2023176 TaxID=3342640 RepID=UPI0035DE6CBD